MSAPAPTEPAEPLGSLQPTTTFSTADLARVEALVDDSGIVALLEPLLPTGGRPRELPLRTLLVGIALTAAANTALYLKRVHEVLLALPTPARRRLGVTRVLRRDGASEFRSVTLRQVELAYSALASLVDGSEHFARHLPEQERAVREQRCELVVQLLLNASLPGDWSSPGHVAVDATFIDANSQPEHTLRRRQIAAAAARAVEEGRARDLPSLLADDNELAKALGVPNFGEDPDIDSIALKRVRRSNRRPADPDAATIVSKGRLRHAYAAHLAVSIPSEDHVAARLAHSDDARAARETGRPVRVPAPEPEPHFILGMKLTASTASPAATCVELTERMAAAADPTGAGLAPEHAATLAHLPAAARTTPPGDTLADRGYSDADIENFHVPMRSLGRRLVFDLHKSHRGLTGAHRGALVAFGNLYSPGLADYPDLLDNKGPSPFAPWDEWLHYFADAQLREQFRLHRNGRPDADGYTRLACPALRRGATLACPVRNTLDLVGSRGLLEVFAPPAAPRPDVCTKRSITVPADVTARSMDLEWGSRAWYDSYVRRRPRVEGINGILKNPAFAALAPMTVRVRGRAKVGLFIAFAAAIANLRATDRWRAQLQRVRELNAAIGAVKRSRAPRRAATLDKLLPARHRHGNGPAPARAP